MLGDAAIFIAQERGYFAEQNIELATQQMTSITDEIPLLATNKLEVGSGADSAGLFNSLADNLGLRLVADNASTAPGHGGGALVIRKDLADAVKTPADLKGKKIGILPGTGTTSQIYLDKLLTPAGVAIGDVTTLPLPFPDMVTALANKSADLAIEVEPFLSAGTQRGIWSSFKDIGDIYPNQEANVMVFSADFANKRPDVAKRFMIARVKAARDYNDAFFKNKNRDAVVAILAKNTTIKDPAAYANLDFSTMNPDGRVFTDSLNFDQNWFADHGYVKTKADLTKTVDNSFADSAVATLGKYQ